MKKVLGLFVGVVLLLSSSTVQAAYQSYRVMPGSQVGMDLGGVFNTVGVTFEVGTVIQVDVQSGVVQAIKIDDIVMARFGTEVVFKGDRAVPGYDLADVTFVNQLGTLSRTTAASTKPGLVPYAKLNKTKKEGFYYGYAIGTSMDLGKTRQNVRPDLPCDVPGSCYLPAKPSMPHYLQYSYLPAKAEIENNKRGFMQLKNRPGIPGFGGPLALEGVASALDVLVKLDIFGVDQTRYTFGANPKPDHQQAMSWHNGRAKVRFNGGDIDGVRWEKNFLGENPDNTAYGYVYWNTNTTLPASGVAGKGSDPSASLPPHSGNGPYFYSKGGLAGDPGLMTWAIPAPTSGVSASMVKFVESGVWQTPQARYIPYYKVTPATSQKVYPEVVSLTLVSPAIMNVGLGVGLVGIVDLNLQRVPEPGPILLMATSALALAGITLARRRKN